MLPRRLLGTLAALVLTLTATACTQTVHGAAQGSITFRDCTKGLEGAGVPEPKALKGKLQFGCARVSVPLDYSDPSGHQITLYIVRVHYTRDDDPIGSLLMNPGGPGASGLEFALGILSELPTKIVQKFDIIGFDPRGVGLSSPIRCISDKQKDELLAEDPDVSTAAGLAEAKQQARQVAHACDAKYGSSLQYYNTENTARDMDRIRQGIGDRRMNYLGFSYGTELGWAYLHLFPRTARAIVLDGAVDPDASDTTQLADQTQGFERAFDQFAAYCKATSPCSQLTDPRRTVDRIASAAQRHPLPTKSGRTLTYGLAITGVLQALYMKSQWAQLGASIISASKGDGTGLLQLADRYNERSANGTYSNVQDANTTIACNDSRIGSDVTAVRRTARSWATRFPLFGRSFASALLGCTGWQTHRTPVPNPKAATPTKVLVIGNLHDPATPYQGAKDLTRDLGNAELLSWNGAGHTSYLQGSSCIDGYVNNYLLTLKLPPRNTTCPK